MPKYFKKPKGRTDGKDGGKGGGADDDMPTKDKPQNDGQKDVMTRQALLLMSIQRKKIPKAVLDAAEKAARAVMDGLPETAAPALKSDDATTRKTGIDVVPFDRENAFEAVSIFLQKPDLSPAFKAKLLDMLKNKGPSDE